MEFFQLTRGHLPYLLKDCTERLNDIGCDRLSIIEQSRLLHYLEWSMGHWNNCMRAVLNKEVSSSYAMTDVCLEAIQRWFFELYGIEYIVDGKKNGSARFFGSEQWERDVIFRLRDQAHLI